jgi:hypothetical protein
MLVTVHSPHSQAGVFWNVKHCRLLEIVASCSGRFISLVRSPVERVFVVVEPPDIHSSRLDKRLVGFKADIVVVKNRKSYGLSMNLRSSANSQTIRPTKLDNIKYKFNNEQNVLT